MIAVVMGAETSKERFADAIKLLNHGFGKCQLYTDDSAPDVKNAEVSGGVEENVSVARSGTFSYLDMTGANLAGVEKKTEINDDLSAPIKKGEVVGHIVYSIDGKEIGRTDLTAGEDVEKAGFLDYLKKALAMLSP